MRLLLADDNEPYRKLLRISLEAEADLDVVGEAENGQVAVLRVRQLEPDIVLMDVTMPVMNGIEATRLVVASFPDVKVIALSMYPDRRFVEAMFAAGVSGYLLKDGTHAELVGALRLVAVGGVCRSRALD